jgi:hypothetical protein
MDAFFTRWETLIRQHTTRTESSGQNEVEIRFGKMNRGSFDTNVGRDTYDKVVRRLKRYDGWESVSEEDTSKFYYEGGRRVTYDNSKGDITECVVKRRVLVDDVSLQSQLFDVRLGISSEDPTDHVEDEEYTKVRNVKRMSFLRKDLRIDVSAVSGDPEDPDSENEVEYQIELELLKVPQSRNELYNMVYKVFDVLKIAQ